jgi:hypothetical protein|tara:strand:- start:1250 stop:1633 length:384 start_codon:yes stop_codon:yes gene_type:complete
MFSVARRAAGRSVGFARGAFEPRVVTTSATQGAAAAAAAPAAQPANMQEFSIYRWSPDDGGKPRYQKYQVWVGNGRAAALTGIKNDVFFSSRDERTPSAPSHVLTANDNPETLTNPHRTTVVSKISG